MTERRRALAVTLALAALLQVVYTYTIPEREGPDEVEHLRYVEALAYRGALPHLAELPYDLRNAAGVRHNVVMKPTMLPPPHSHQAQHPPLVYAVYAVGLRLADSLGLPPRCLRLVGLLWLALAAYALWRLAGDLFWRWPVTAALLPAAVLLPGPLYLGAVVTNDAAALAAGSFVLWRTLRLLVAPPTWRETAWLGLALAVGLLVKANLLVFLPFSLVLLAWAAARSGAGAGQVAARVAVVLALAVLPVVPFWLHNHSLYGAALVRAHGRPLLMSVEQLRTEPDAPFLIAAQTMVAIMYVLPTTLLPGWLLFNLGLTPAQSLFIAVWAVVVVCLVGLREWRRQETALFERRAVLLCLMLLLTMLLLYLQQVLFQDSEVGLFGGRYFMPLLGALAAPLLLGIEANLPPRWRAAAPGWLLGLAVLLALALLPVVLSRPAS